MNLKVSDKLVTIKHSSTGWALYHPADLRARRKHPAYWWDFQFAIAKEFNRGSLIAVVADFDDNVQATCRIGDLTSREKNLVIDSAVFRLKVRFSQLFFTALDELPCDRYEPLIDDDSVENLIIPNGRYEVTVYTIAWVEETGAFNPQGEKNSGTLTDYVICFRPVESFDHTLVADGVPHLMVNDFPVTGYIAPRFDEVDIRSPYPFVYLPDQIPLPGVTTYLKFPVSHHGSLLAAMERPDWSLVISPVDTCPGIGVIFSLKALSEETDDAGSVYLNGSGIGVKVVEIRGLAAAGEGGWFAEVTALHAPGSSYFDEHDIQEPSVSLFAKIKRLFLRGSRVADFGYHEVDPYEAAEKIELMRALKSGFKRFIQQEAYPYPDFALERIQAILSLSLLTYVVADEMGFSFEDRRSLFLLTDEAERAKMVLKRLNRVLS